MPAIHTEAARGFQQGAEAYARGRPGYPAEADVWLTCDLGLGPGSTVVELGAGTGKFTTRLVATGATVIAVEPVAAMRAQLAASAPAARILDGTAEAIPLPDASANVVVCAQSFHWFATPVAVAEIARVLKPGGQLGLIWNTRDDRVP
ncbi:class I SAM-dependent methyltransferase [Zavarzinia sp. CC-PAN008]|uniref:class I SAM-dependent methyltransferase n=1 Tax=Zavarzinia sp. CC-PAN008 TaxID=3243332 RepID=UPI003F74A821